MVITQHIPVEELFGTDIILAVMFVEDVLNWEFDIYFWILWILFLFLFMNMHCELFFPFATMNSNYVVPYQHPSGPFY